MSTRRRKARRAEEQAAIEALYHLCEDRIAERGRANPPEEGEFDALADALAHYDRFFRCPRCNGHGDDPVQPPRSFEAPMGEPPDPCGLCDGHTLIGPTNKVPPWVTPEELDRDHAYEAEINRPLTRPLNTGDPISKWVVFTPLEGLAEFET